MDFKVLTSSAQHLMIRSGLIGATSLNQEIGLFDYGNVLVQKDYLECDNVRIVSGGPYYMGDLIGKGMLTSVIQGDNFTAPPSNLILRTLHEMGNEHIMGTIVIISLSSGSLLNFGLAIERAYNAGLRLRMLTLSDDHVNAQQPKISRRTLGGIVFLYKIAGAMSEARKTISEIYHFCEKLVTNIVSMEIELPEPRFNPEGTCVCLEDDVSTPKKPSNKPSITSIKVNLANLINIFDEDPDGMFGAERKEEICGKLNLEIGDQVVILINNNMVLSKLEEYFLVKDILEYLMALNIICVKFYVGDFIKIPDACLSISMIKVSDEAILEYLDAPCTAPGWLRVNQGLTGPLTTDNILTGTIRKTTREEPPIKGPILSERGANILLFSMQFACNALISCEKQLNIIDSDRADGDTGTRMKTLAELLLKRMKHNKIVMKYPYTFFDNLSIILERSLGGTTGCIYSIMLEAAAHTFGKYDDKKQITSSLWIEAFEAAVEALKKYGNIDYGDGTMYDPLYVFCKLAKIEITHDQDDLIAFGKGVHKAEEAIEETKKGRPFPDPGAHAVGIWMRAIYEGVKARWPY